MHSEKEWRIVTENSAFHTVKKKKNQKCRKSVELFCGARKKSVQGKTRLKFHTQKWNDFFNLLTIEGSIKYSWCILNFLHAANLEKVSENR